MSYLDERRKHIEAGRPLPKKKLYWLNNVSPKRQAKLDEQKAALGGGESDLQKWFGDRRNDLTGICKCGCGNKSEKFSDKKFRASCCHVFPQRIFKSIALHPQNFVERAWESGCHSNMDNRSMDLWPNFDDWGDIKEKFHVLAPLLTDQERAKKFYKHLEKLVYAN